MSFKITEYKLTTDQSLRVGVNRRPARLAKTDQR